MPRGRGRWYRAPELLLGARTYSWAVDLWSCGCIAGELLGHKPLLPGRSEANQLELMFDLLGSPSDAIWPGCSLLPNAAALRAPHQPYNNLSQRFPQLARAGLDLLDELLAYDPDKRPKARRVVMHDYLRQARRAPSLG
jgi:serine/threonine protein kinase